MEQALDGELLHRIWVESQNETCLEAIGDAQTLLNRNSIGRIAGMHIVVHAQPVETSARKKIFLSYRLPVSLVRVLEQIAGVSYPCPNIGKRNRAHCDSNRFVKRFARQSVRTANQCLDFRPRFLDWIELR